MLAVSGSAAALNVGDPVFYTVDPNTPIQADDGNSPVRFGNALDPLPLGGVSTIRVLLRSAGSDPVPPGMVPAKAGAVSRMGSSAATSITLMWDAVTDDGGSAITGYTLQYKLTSATNYTTTDVGDVTSFEITGLLPGQSYDYRVAAVNSIGTGDYSIIFTESTLITKPGTPRNLAATSTKTTIAFTWDAPLSDGGSEITDYIVGQRTVGAFIWVTATVSATPRLRTYADLTPGTAYEFDLQARNAAGDGPRTAIFTYSTEAATVPAKMDAPLRTSSTRSQIRINWSPPSDDGGADVDMFDIRWKLGTSLAWTDSSEVAASTTSSNIGSLTAGTAYDFAVRARNSVGWGEWSDSTSISTNAATTPSRQAIPTAGALTSTTITFSWLAPTDDGGSPVNGYAYQWKETSAPSFGFTDRATVDDTVLSATITGLTASTSYDIEVVATNIVGGGQWSPTLTVSTTA